MFLFYQIILYNNYIVLRTTVKLSFSRAYTCSLYNIKLRSFQRHALDNDVLILLRH